MRVYESIAACYTGTQVYGGVWRLHKVKSLRLVRLSRDRRKLLWTFAYPPLPTAIKEGKIDEWRKP